MTEIQPLPEMEGPLASRAVAVAATRVTLLVVGTIASVVIARTLGPTGRGQYAFAVAVATTLTALAHASVEQAQIYLVSIGTTVRRLAANGVALGAGLGAAAVVLLLALSTVTGYPSQHPFSDVALLLALATVPVSVVVLYANGLLVLQGRTDLLNRTGLLAGITQCALLVGLAAADRLTVVTVLAVWLLNAAAPLIISLSHLRPAVRDLSWDLARRELSLGLRYHAGLSSLYLLLRVDVLLLAALRSDADVGLYALAVSLVELTNIATDAVATVVMKRQVTISLEDAAVLTARVIGVTVVLATVAVLGLVVSAGFVVPLVYGEEFAGAVPALYALGPGVLALAATRSAGGYLVRLNRPWVVSLLATTAMIVNVALNLALIPRFGIVGAGLASSVAYVGLAAAYLIWMCRASGVGLRAFSPRR
jgi:O-antigen/teichoic acid export membrane protein